MPEFPDDDKTPIREIFAGCCASTDKQSAKSMVQSARQKILLFMNFSRSSLSVPCSMRNLHLITRSARASVFGGIPYDLEFSILDSSARLRTGFRLFGHRITLSALARTLGGILRSICFAVFTFTINSNLVGCSTGMSAGFVPFKILFTKTAARRYSSSTFGP